jgi:hypothetical protein
MQLFPRLFLLLTTYFGRKRPSSSVFIKPKLSHCTNVSGTGAESALLRLDPKSAAKQRIGARLAYGPAERNIDGKRSLPSA